MRAETTLFRWTRTMTADGAVVALSQSSSQETRSTQSVATSTETHICTCAHIGGGGAKATMDG